jgi:hypothetical protein
MVRSGDVHVGITEVPMRLFVLLGLSFAVTAAPIQAQNEISDDQGMLEWTSRVGQMLHAYHSLLNVAVDAIEEAGGSVASVYAGGPYDDGWAFSFGEIEDDGTFVLDHGVIVSGSGEVVQFDAFEYRREASVYHQLAARALKIVRTDFQRFREREEFEADDYRFAVLPFPRNEMTAFVTPAQTDPCVTHMGNDLMYTLSREEVYGLSWRDVQVREPTRFHYRLLSVPVELPPGAHASLVVPDAPLPSPADVLHTMHRGTPLIVAAGHGEYVIQPDGRVQTLDPESELATMLREAARQN